MECQSQHDDNCPHCIGRKLVGLDEKYFSKWCIGCYSYEYWTQWEPTQTRLLGKFWLDSRELTHAALFSRRKVLSPSLWGNHLLHVKRYSGRDLLTGNYYEDCRYWF